MINAALALLVAALAYGQEPKAAPPSDTPLPPTVVRSGGAFTFPERALARGVEFGVATLDCEITPSGALTDCRVVSEDPVGFGFGQAALSGVLNSRISPETAARTAPETRSSFRIVFRLPDPDSVPQQPNNNSQ
ncbi:MAG: hypothetical protein EON96_19155 [Caulobacteraceae bacterium]|nr:MAG: hypothetical protein EON96_19155 [Caulobacteraceae bacterium]